MTLDIYAVIKDDLIIINHVSDYRHSIYRENKLDLIKYNSTFYNQPIIWNN
jgi:hypothetical protein